SLSASLTFAEIRGIFFHGMKMDLSMVSYLMVIPGILLAFSFLYSPKVLGAFFKIYTFLLLTIITLLNVMDLGLYPHWGTRLGVITFDYMKDPEGVIANVLWKDVLAALAVVLFYCVLFIWFFNRFLSKDILNAARQKWYFSPVMILLTGLLFIPIRGGLGTSPINLSTVSFSSKLYVNQASYNFLWNFFKTVEQRKKSANPCNYFSNEEAFKNFYLAEKQRINTDSLIVEIDTANLPNVVLIILESFSNKVISSFGGQYGVCPNIDSLSADAILFPSFYASGNRSDRGIAAILGSYPSLLSQSIINFPDKTHKLTMMSDYFNRHGYWSSFYYGGDINFYNLKSFVLQGEYKDVVSQEDFPNNVKHMSNWGAPDGYLFELVLNEINKPQPFFTVAYTLSSHPPYDVPTQKIKGQSNEEKYLNSLAYTDSCLGDFIRAFKKTKYWDNSLVIITADHGALYPGPTEIIEPATYRIPLIWTGGVVKKPATINKIGGQPDLIPTLVKQFGWEPDSALFGHDILSTPSYAFYMCSTGWGYVTNEGEFYYDQGTGILKSFVTKNNAQPDLNFAKSYLQVLHEDFLLK
ncbi:MAG TPA: sulfatase-like hydrolase/transferase, partial [Draconibacterium sp.]|nr:sulfatase-like hydrolase/transferase [Draconibacterium sp.]